MNRRARRRVRAALFLCCALLFPFPLAPQEPPPAGEQGAAGEQNPGEQPAQADQDAEPGPPSEHTVLEMDIKTSTLSELAAWCRLLGLSEAGAREDLAGRLRGYYALPPPVAPEEKQRVITIEAARTTEYFTLEVVDESYARLQGGVVISLKDGEAVHRIKAGEILYNRTRNIMTASGSVEYVKREGDTTETFRGESITVNLDSWSSIFLDGLTERALGAGAADANTYRFAGTLIARSNEEVTVLENATVTNAKNEEAYWSLNARKLWLLPGSDWAVLGAVLKVGEIPVFYFPFFHFAADEVIFHPALGYRSRVGNFVQTTTYLLGRPKRDGAKESSLSKMMGTAGESERVREGIFLRSTGKKAKDPNEARLSVLFDAYANLGTYLGTELVLPKKGILGAIGLSAGIGFTRDIYRVNAAYSPFAQYDGSDNWNSANLFSVEVPFRYRFITTGSLSGKYGSLNWSFPFYSDLYVNQDFMERSEEMDWVALFKRDAEEEAANKNVLGSSYEWRINASLAPITKLAPYVSSFSVSNISSGVVFRSRQSTVINNGVSPNRSFFFPDTLTLYSANLSASGTPLTLGNPAPAPAADKAAAPEEDAFKGAGTFISPWGAPPGAGGGPKSAEYDGGFSLSPPALAQRFDLPKAGGPRLAVDYALTPSSATQLLFRSSQRNWDEAGKVDWSQISSLLTTFKADGHLGFTLSQPETGLYNAAFRLSGTGQWQDHVYINEEAEEYTNANGEADQAKIDSVRLTDYKATFFTTYYNITTTLKPLYQHTVFGNSTIQYNLKGVLFKNEFDGTSDDPSWKTRGGEWVKEDADAHTLTGALNASLMDYAQNITLTADLPPRDPTFGGNATFRMWITETNIRHKILDPWDFDKRKFEPVYITETIRFGKAHPFLLKQDLTFDPELAEYTNITSSISWFGVTASFSASRSRPYTLEATGWVQSSGAEELNPREFRLAYAGAFKKESLFKKRLSFSFDVSSGLTLDLQRYTYSRFDFSLKFTLKITSFLDFSLSATSQNAVVFRYFQNMPFFDLPAELPGEQNFFVDLANSFRFDDESLRRSSGFKLKSFTLALTHHLGDWDAKLGITLSPYLDQSARPYQYKFNNEISFIVQWIPISEIKTEITSNKDKSLIK